MGCHSFNPPTPSIHTHTLKVYGRKNPRKIRLWGQGLGLSLLLCDSKPLFMFASQFPCQRQEQGSPS